MLNRRKILAFPMALCLLLSLLSFPQGPVLVCQVTGEPMAAPVAVSRAKTHDSCCDVVVSAGADGAAAAAHYALTAPGCCDLRQSSEHMGDLPAATVPAPEVSAAVLTSSLASVPLPLLIPIAVETEVQRESAPRAPPLTGSSPRAPPFFS